LNKKNENTIVSQKMDKQIKCKKWIPLSKEITAEYEEIGYICKGCNMLQYPTFVHVGQDCIGEYTCYLCGKDGNIRNICVYCNFIKKTGGDRR
jgi:hypothetical protein